MSKTPKQKSMPNEPNSASKAPMVFISHDTRDAELAEAFSKMLQVVSGGLLKAFRSSDRKGSEGIEYGVEWYPETMSYLNNATDVVCLLTERSMNRPWILYEAGVAKGKLNTTVYGIALGIPLGEANTTGPFAQFQNCDDNEDSLCKLVISLVKKIPGADPPQDSTLVQVKTFKDSVAKSLLKLGDKAQKKEQGGEAASVAKLFEEIKVMFSDLPGRIESELEERGPLRRRMHMHPKMLHMMMDFGPHGDPGDPITLLMLTSPFHADMPWIYELGRAAYDAIRQGNQDDARRSLEDLRRGIHSIYKTPFMFEMGADPEFLRELEHMIEHFSTRWLKSDKIRAKKEQKS